ncbi:MAG: hypothetical protein AAGP08_03230 [Pseudomonadota bacterium]
MTNTLTIKNHWTGTGAPKMYLWLEYKATGSSNVKLDGADMTPEAYHEMTSDQATLTWDTINAGNLSFVTFKDDTPTKGKWSINDATSFGGFIEFTKQASDTAIWADLSNVDGVGLLCGLDGLPSDEGGKAGFKYDQSTFVTNLLGEFSALPAAATVAVEISGQSYKKVIAPGKSPADDPDPWNAVLGTYYQEIIGADREIDLVIPNFDNGTWTGKQYKEGKTFTGIGLDDVPMAIKISATFSPDKSTPDTKYTYDVYVAQDKWTVDTISKADAAHAVYVRTDNPSLPAFTDTSGDRGTMWENGTGTLPYGYNSMGFNPSLSADSTQPFPIQSIAFALSRIAAVIQEGYINPDGGVIAYPSDTSHLYGGNKYNEWILANSNSYGQPYSDGQARVLYRPKDAFTLHILAPDDATTSSYYASGGGVSPLTGPQYQITIGGGANAVFDKITIGDTDFKGANGAFMIPGGTMAGEDMWVSAVMHYTAAAGGGTASWRFKLDKNPNAYGQSSPPAVSDTVQTADPVVTGLNWTWTGNKDVPWNLATPVIKPPST